MRKSRIGAEAKLNHAEKMTDPGAPELENYVCFSMVHITEGFQHQLSGFINRVYQT